jgi:hypothetical protein
MNKNPASRTGVEFRFMSKKRAQQGLQTAFHKSMQTYHFTGSKNLRVRGADRE